MSLLWLTAASEHDPYAAAQNDWFSERQYQAEHLAGQHVPNRPLDHAQAEHLAGRFTASRSLPEVPVVFHDGLGDASGYGRDHRGRRTIFMGPDSRHEGALLHELVHHQRCTTGTDEPGPDHGHHGFSRDYHHALTTHHSAGQQAADTFFSALNSAHVHMLDHPENFPEAPPDAYTLAGRSPR